MKEIEEHKYFLSSASNDVLIYNNQVEEIINRILDGIMTLDYAVSHMLYKHSLFTRLTSRELRTRDSKLGNYSQLCELAKPHRCIDKIDLLSYGTDEEKDLVDFTDLAVTDLIFVTNILESIVYLHKSGVDFVKYIIYVDNHVADCGNPNIMLLLNSILDYIKDFSFVPELTNVDLIKIIDSYTSQI